MQKKYRAILNPTHLTWIDEPPELPDGTRFLVTVLSDDVEWEDVDEKLANNPKITPIAQNHTKTPN